MPNPRDAIRPPAAGSSSAPLSSPVTLPLTRFQQTGELKYADQAIREIREATSAVSDPSDDQLSLMLAWMTRTLEQRYSSTGMIQYLDEALKAARQGVVTASGQPEHRRPFLESLSSMLGRKFSITNDEATIDEAVQTARLALECTPKGGDLDWTGYQMNLANRLSQRYSHAGAREDLDEAILFAEDAMEAAGDGDLDQNRIAAMAGNLGLLFSKRFQLTESREDLDKGIDLARMAVALSTPDDPLRLRWLINLGISLDQCFSTLGEVEHIDEAISLTEEAIEATHPHDPTLPTMYVNLALRLSDRFHAASTKDVGDIDRAICLASMVLAEMPSGYPGRPKLCGVLGVALGRRGSHCGTTADIDESVMVLREAVAGTPPTSPARIEQLDNMATALHMRFKESETAADLNEIIAALQEAVESPLVTGAERVRRLEKLAYEVNRRYSRTKEAVHLDEVIQALRDLVRATPEGDAGLPDTLRNLASRLSDRFLVDGERAYIDDAIRLMEQLVESSGSQSPSDLDSLGLGLLGVLLHQRFSSFGDMDDLERSIRSGKEALEATAPDDADRRRVLSRLAVPLNSRFEVTGDMRDLDDAIRFARDSTAAVANDDPDKSDQLATLAMALYSRFKITGQLADLEEAFQVARAGTEAARTTDDRDRFMSSLSAYLFEMFTRNKRADYLDEAVQLAREAVANAHLSSYRLQRMANLAAYLTMRFNWGRRQEDVDEAVRLAEDVVYAMPADHQQRSIALSILAGGLDASLFPQGHSARAVSALNVGLQLDHSFRHTGLQSEREEAASWFLKAVRVNNGPIHARIMAGLQFLSVSDMEHSDLGELYSVARSVVDLIPLLVPMSLRAPDKQHRLSEAVGIASDAAALALHMGQEAASAVRLLETGRGLIAGALQDLRSDISVLSEEHPEMARRFVGLRDRLDASSGESAESSGAHHMHLSLDLTAASSETDRLLEANKQMDELLGEVRRLPGHENFLMGGTTSQMRDAAAYGPIVIVNVSKYRCDALVIETGGIRALELPRLTLDGLASHAAHVGSVSTLSWLWDAVVGPVLQMLGFDKAPDRDDQRWPRVWWVPTGPLVRFSLHAAGHHFSRRGETALDRVVSSYSSSVKTIINTRKQRLARSGGTGAPSSKAVLVAMRDTPGQTRLHHAEGEVDEVARVCGAMGVACARPPRDRTGVLAALPACDVFHFAGHGGTDPVNPLRSRLLLADRAAPLTVESLLETNLQSRRPFLAYLSACGTGQVRDEGAVDESIHLTSAFQLAGFRHVVGTLWDVEDAVCVEVARAVYEALRDGVFEDDSVSAGLHFGLKKLRDDWVASQEELRRSRRTIGPAEPDGDARPMWVPYVHFGV
ncbi:hypothetical protein CPLU01_15790 [Colletotrichum plurivorum]|uniref:CHAT domain-containing protein n=1 Tax=Colletotrichum plurivorum TaxID=2175906 RepID=A0A8H6J7B9_9PEZI|nr:hypothetical protein CPLU01_15790 [Colletotrichum plurivorum]